MLVTLLILIVILFIARALLRGLNAPAWSDQVLIGIGLLIALILVAQAFGISTPNLR